MSSALRSVAVISAFVALGLAASCAQGKAGAPRRAAIVDDRPLVTAGPRCTDGGCRCREVDARGDTIGENAETPIAADMKRFEFRAGRGNDEVKITVEGRGSLHKGGETIDAACGYVDLPAGEHRVHVHVKASPGDSSPRFLIYEYGEQTHSWYQSFGFSCGDSNVCTRGDLDARFNELQSAHGLFDKCGSVKVTGLRWESDKAADERVNMLDVDLTLKVYRFTPRFPRGGACKGPSPE